MLVRHAREATSAEQGVIVLVEERAEGLAAGRTAVRTEHATSIDAVRPSDPVIGWMQLHRDPLLVHNPDSDPRFQRSDWPPSVRTAVGVPLLVNGRLTGVLILYNKVGDRQFSADDARLLTILAAQSAQVIERARLATAEEEARAEKATADAERERVRRIFGEHTAPSIVDAVLNWSPDQGAGQRESVTVMFVDLRGFTRRAERWAPDRVVAYLNGFFELSVSSVSRHRGVVHQLLGDGLLAYFGAPIPNAAHAEDAVRAALDLLAVIDNATSDGTLQPTNVGIGLHSGDAVVGLVGSAIHREFKVTGDVVNVAARIEKLNKRFDSRLLITSSVWDQLAVPRPIAKLLGDIALDGRDAPVTVYRLA
jgi:class 3 adenylate cyclase